MKFTALISLLVSTLLIIVCTVTAGEEDSLVIFLGTVQNIVISPLEKCLDNYVVQCRVDKILSGDIACKTFSFRIHSPTQSGLEIGKQYTIVATRTAEGFVVDQYQWIKRSLTKE